MKKTDENNHKSATKRSLPKCAPEFGLRGLPKSARSAHEGVLTNANKKSIIQGRGASSFNRIFVEAKVKIKILCKDYTKGLWRISRRTLGYFVSFFSLEKTMSSKLKKISGLAAGVAFVAILAACGGGSSTPTQPTTVTQTVTCPDGTSQTATAATAALALDAATAACPGINVAKVTVTPTDKATGVSPDTIATSGIVVATSSTLATPAISDITLKAGTVAVPVTVTMTVGSKGFKFVPSTKLLYAQVYTYAVDLTDTLGKKLPLSGSFTTASVSCTAPLVPDSAGTSCVPPACTLPAVWNGSACVVPVLHYEAVLDIWTGSQIFIVTPTGVALANNKTQYTTGDWPLWGCWVPNPSTKVGILADGQILHSCQDAGTLHRHYLALNPITGDQTIYTGPVPATLQCVENADSSWTCPAKNDWVVYQTILPAGAPANVKFAAQVGNGWFVAPDAYTVNFEPTTGTGSTVANKPNTPMSGLFTYSN